MMYCIRLLTLICWACHIGTSFGKASCPIGWTALPTGCYRFVEATSFTQAITRCEEEGGFTAEIKSQKEQDAFSQFMIDSGFNKKNVWLGASLVGNEWIWFHSKEKMTFSAWIPGQPSGGSETCVAAWGRDDTTLWNDIVCDQHGTVALCQYSPQSGYIVSGISTKQLNAASGSTLWTDRSYVITQMPQELVGSTIIQPAHYVDISTIEVFSHHKATIYVGVYEARDGGLMELLPGQGWTLRDGWFVQWNSGENERLHKIWSKQIDAGETISFTTSKNRMTFAIFISEEIPLVTTTTVAPPKDLCPAGWTSVLTGCYRFLKTEATFDQAKTNCKNEGGIVAEADTEAKLNALSKFHKDSGMSVSVWLGASDVAKEGEWIWIHSGKKMTFNAWGGSEPNNAGGNEDCLHWDGNTHWNDLSCTYSGAAVYTLCEYEGCPEGYTAQSGDVPGWGSLEGDIKEKSREDCAKLCDLKDSCLSFEHSHTTKICNLNKEKNPTTSSHEDYQYCSKEGEWTAAVWLNDDATKIVTNIEEEAFNTQFTKCPVVQYTRNGAVHSVYKRTSPVPASFNAFAVFTNKWISTNNQMDTDFRLYDNLENAKSDTEAWTLCNYNDDRPGDDVVGYPRDCGKGGYVGWQWFRMPDHQGGGTQGSWGITSGIGFDIYSGPICPASMDISTTTTATTTTATTTTTTTTTTGTPSSTTNIPSCPTTVQPTCPPTPSCPTTTTPTCPTIPKSTCPPTVICPEIPEPTKCPTLTTTLAPTCPPIQTCPTIPEPTECPTLTTKPIPTCPAIQACPTTVASVAGACSDKGCKNAFKGLGMCVDTSIADWNNVSKIIDFTAETKDGKCGEGCNCKCFKHTGCFSSECDAHNGICLIQELEDDNDNRAFFIPSGYSKAFPCDKSLDCHCYLRKETITQKPRKICKPNKKCTKKRGKCYATGEKVPEGAKYIKGLCGKKTGCKCYRK